RKIVRRRFPRAVVEVFLEGFFVDLDAQTWAFGDFDVAVDDLERLLEQAFAKRGLFLAEEVGRAGVDLDADSQRDGAERAMRRHRDVARFRGCGDLAGFEDPADVRGVRLKDGNRLTFDELLELPAGVQPFARGEGAAWGRRDAHERIGIAGEDRFFDKHQVILFESPQKLASQRRAGAAVQVDGDVDLAPDAFARLSHEALGLVEVGWRLDRLGGPDRAEFVGCERVGGDAFAATAQVVVAAGIGQPT